MKLSDTHAFNCIDLMVKFGQTSCEDILPALHKIVYIKKVVYNKQGSIQSTTWQQPCQKFVQHTYNLVRR